jgi:hypothetical protein
MVARYIGVIKIHDLQGVGDIDQDKQNTCSLTCTFVIVSECRISERGSERGNLNALKT